MQTSLLPPSLSTSLPQYTGQMATFQVDGKELSFPILGVDIDLSRRKTGGNTSKTAGSPEKPIRVTLRFQVANTNPYMTLNQAARLLTAPVWASIPDLAEGMCKLSLHLEEYLQFEFVNNPEKMNQKLLYLLIDHLS